MELLGNLKDKVAKSKNREEARNIIEEAGMRLTDDELNMVAGGSSISVGGKTLSQGHLGARCGGSAYKGEGWDEVAQAAGYSGDSEKAMKEIAEHAIFY